MSRIVRDAVESVAICGLIWLSIKRCKNVKKELFDLLGGCRFCINEDVKGAVLDGDPERLSTGG